MRQIFLFVFCPGFCFDSSLSGCQGYIFHCVQKPEEVLVRSSAQWAERRFSFSFQAFLCKFLNKIVLVLQCA